MRVVFFGTPPFAAEVLDYLLTENIEIVAVISKPDRPQGRLQKLMPTAVKQFVVQNYPSIPLYQPEEVSALSFAPQLAAYQADLFVVVAYGEILRTHVLEMPRLACLNLHASLLPAYRGAAPIQRALIEGQKETGITIMHMVKKMDAGNIIQQRSIQIDPTITFGELQNQLCQIGKKALVEVIHTFSLPVLPLSFPQNPAQVTFAPKIEVQDCKINWHHSTLSIHNLIRGVNPFPGAWCEVKIGSQIKRLKIYRTTILPNKESEKMTPPILCQQPSEKGNIVIQVADGCLELEEVQLEGKKISSSKELLRGYPHIEFMELNH